ncbi:hypothetical protein LguiA_001978 [Lonicera macranthoides]
MSPNRSSSSSSASSRRTRLEVIKEEDENEEVNDPESNKSSPSKTDKGKKAGCSKVKEVDDDSESDKAGPSKAPNDVPKSLFGIMKGFEKLQGQGDLDSESFNPKKVEAKAQNVGCSEIEEDDDLESNKAGPSRAQEKEKFDPKLIPDRAYEVKYLRAEVNKLSSQVDILKCKIDDLKSGHRSRSGYLRVAIRRYQHRQQDGKSSPSLERVAKDEDERPEGKAHVSELSTSKQLQEEDSVGILNLFDEIYANQLMLFEEVDLLLAEVNVLVYKALGLSKTTVRYEEAPTFPNIVAELIRLRVTTTIEPRSLFGGSLDLAEKVNLLRTQVVSLESLVANPKSPLRSHAGSWISGYFRQHGRSSPALGRVRQTESSSSDAALERWRGKEVLKGVKADLKIDRTDRSALSMENVSTTGRACKPEALSDSEPEPEPEPAPAQSGKTTSVVPRPDDWKGQREMEENITDEERHRMQAEEGSISEQDKPRVTKDKGRVGGVESKLVLRPPIVPVIKPSDHEAIQNWNEELSDDERARAMQQTGPFPGLHPVGPSCWYWICDYCKQMAYYITIGGVVGPFQVFNSMLKTCYLQTDEEEKSLNAGCSEIKKVDDDSESNKAGPSKAGEEKAPNAGCSEIKEVDDDSESNKAGPRILPHADTPSSTRPVVHSSGRPCLPDGLIPQRLSSSANALRR